MIGQLSAQSLSPIKRDHGIKMASKIRAIKYLECSALTQRGLKQVRAHAQPGSRCSLAVLLTNQTPCLLTFVKAHWFSLKSSGF